MTRAVLLDTQLMVLLAVGLTSAGIIASTIVAARREYHRLGITDAAILQCSAPDREILTADAELYIAAMQLGMPATNFNHKREEFGVV